MGVDTAFTLHWEEVNEAKLALLNRTEYSPLRARVGMVESEDESPFRF